MLDMMTWGFPPPPKSRAPVTNVRNLASPFWRSALNNPDRRCLVPVSEFCEWEGEVGSKRDRWFSLPSSPVFAFAGIWGPTETGKAFAFLTCEPNPLVAPIHANAMPVILHPEDYEGWLDGEVERPALAGSQRSCRPTAMSRRVRMQAISGMSALGGKQTCRPSDGRFNRPL